MSDDRLAPPAPPSPFPLVSRRTFVLSGAAAAAMATLLRGQSVVAETGSPAGEPAAPPAGKDPSPRIPLSPGLTPSQSFDDALQALLVDAEPVIGEPLTLELPELAENGNVVPYTIAVESPMTDTDYVRTLHLMSTANPQPVVATFHLIPASGKASVSGRMRLAKTQDVVAIAELSTGQILVTVRKVDVTIGGCGNE